MALAKRDPRPLKWSSSKPAIKSTNGKLFSRFWTIACYTCCVLHWTNTMATYFSYKTTTFVSVEVPQEFRPPAISLCIQLVDLADDLNIHNHPLDLIMNKMTKTWMDVKIVYEKLLFGSFKGERTKWKEFYRHFQKCVKIELTSRVIKIQEILKWWAEPSYILDLELDLKAIGLQFPPANEVLCEILFHQSNILPAVDDVVSTHLHLKRHNVFEFEYREVKTTSLSWPYSHCQRYTMADGTESKTGFDSQGACFERCREDMVHEKRGLWHGLVSTTIYNFTIGEYKYDDNVHQTCHFKCPQPCQTKSFFPLLTREVPNDTYEYYHFQISDTSPRTTIVMKPKTTIAEVVIFIGSIGGLWLGLSIHGTLFNVVLRVRKLLVKDQIVPLVRPLPMKLYFRNHTRRKK